jgi:hypothetical protein
VLAVHQSAAGKPAGDEQQQQQGGGAGPSGQGQVGEGGEELISQVDLRKYIAFARGFEPTIPKELTGGWALYHGGGAGGVRGG